MMTETTENTERLLAQIEELKLQLFEANSIIEAIREGGVDALVLTRDGIPNVYSIESADYTYRVLIEKFGEGALSISESGLILYCNEAFAQLIGKPANKIIGTFFNSYVQSVGQFQELKNRLNSSQCKGEITLNIDGRQLPIYVSLSDLHPQVPAIGIIVTDLSEKRKHEEALAQYQRKLEAKVNELNQTNGNLGQFIHVISHDIKEPVRKIVSYASHLGKNHLSEEKRESELKVISESASRLNSLVDDLVKYSFSTNKMTHSEVRLDDILNDVLDDLEILVWEHNAVIKFHGLPTVIGSEVQLRQVFSNLLTNAVKYKKHGQHPTIVISSEIVDCVDVNFPNKKFHKIAVHDDGIGMDTGQLEKIFTIFHRLHKPGEYSGNGIGLAICKRIMENHQGKIDVESAPNDGSTFNVYFPLYTA